MEPESKSNELQSRFDLRTLLETSRMLIESRETDFVLNNLLLITMGKLLVPRGCILICEQKNKLYSISKLKGNGVVREGDTIELPWHSSTFDTSVVRFSEIESNPPTLFRNQKGGIFFNLRTSNHHLGYLYLDNKVNGNELHENEIEFVESLVIISSVAIINSRMFSEMREINRKLDRRVYELHTLLDLSKDFSVMVDREKIANTFKFALLGQLLIRTFFLIYKTDENLELLGSNGLKKDPDRDDKQKIFDFAEDVIYNKPELLKEIPFLHKNGIKALVSLNLQGEKTAVVGVGSRANLETYTEPDFNFLQSLGNLTVLSIQKTQLLQERIEKERLEEELTIAKTIQQGFLPDPIPTIPTLDLSAINIPSSQVGGDYFDIIETPDTNFILAIGDVTGKGIPAALLMANLQSMLHILLPVDITLSEATGRINDLIHENTPGDKFITFFWGKYFKDERRLRYVNAGHNPPMLLRHDSSEMIELDEGGLILGALPASSPYDEGEIHLHKGDIVTFFTDGVTEIFNEEDEEYGEGRLFNVIVKNRNQPADKIRNHIIDDVLAYSTGKLFDDMTLIVFKVNG